MISTIKKLSLASLLLCTSHFAYAMAVGPYWGIQVGESNTHNLAKDVQTGLTPPTVNVKPDNTGISERLIIFGYQFNEYGAFELGYTHFSPSTYKIPVPNTIQNTPQIHENGVDMLGKVLWTLPAGFTVFGKFGVTVLRASPSGSLMPIGTRSKSQTSLRPTLGVGASYDLTQSWQVDLTALTVMAGGGVKSVSFMSLGITYHWVDYYCGQFLC